MKQVPLSRGQFAVVDDEDFDTVAPFKWSVKPGKPAQVPLLISFEVGEFFFEFALA